MGFYFLVYIFIRQEGYSAELLGLGLGADKGSDMSGNWRFDSQEMKYSKDHLVLCHEFSLGRCSFQALYASPT